MAQVSEKKARPRSARNKGSGIVYEIREAVGDTREAFGPRIFATARDIEQWEQKGKHPLRDRMRRRELLQIALTIPESDWSPALCEWIADEQAFWKQFER